MLEAVRAVPVESDGAAAVDRDPHSASPAQSVRGALHGFDLDLALNARHTLELLFDSERLQAPLSGQLDVLVVTSAAASRPGVRARWGDSVWRRFEDFDGVGAEVGGGRRRHLSPHPLARERMAHEHDPAVGRPGHATASGGCCTDLQFQHL